MSAKLPVVERIDIKASDRFGTWKCIAVLNDGQRVVLPIKGFTKSYPHSDMSEATLTMYGFRVQVEDVSQPSDFTFHIDEVVE